jgi:hypothetical protein
MSVRIEIELTSARPDGSWTWRAAGAREPKGVAEAGVIPADAKVGQVLKVEVERGLDYVEIVSVLGGRAPRKEAERLQLIGSGDFQPVIEQRAPRSPGDRDRGDRGDRRGDRPRGDRPDRPRGDRPDRGPRGDGPGRGDRPGGPRQERSDRGPRPDRPRGDRPDRGPRGDRPDRPSRPAFAPKPQPRRLKAGRAHRSAYIASLPEEHRPIAEQLARGGMAAVRQALDEQNASLKAEGKPEVRSDGVLRLAEELFGPLRDAEWRDRADAAMAHVDDLDLRDLRSVVVQAADAAKDDEARTLATNLREALARRQDGAHQEWLTEIAGALGDGRVVRALRLSSRPPKAGVPFPADLAARLTEATNGSLTGDAFPDRWIAVLEAAAFAPVHAQVVPAGVPATVTPELRDAVVRYGPLLRQVATAFGVEVAADAKAPRPPRPQQQRPPAKKAAPPAAPAAKKPSPPAAPVVEPITEPEQASAPAESAPVADAIAPVPEVEVEVEVVDAAADALPGTVETPAAAVEPEPDPEPVGVVADEEPEPVAVAAAAADEAAPQDGTDAA